MHEAQLSPAQRRLWLLDQRHPHEPLLNHSLALRIHGPLDVEALSWAVAEIAHRHEVLRSEILVYDDRPYRMIKSLELRLAVEDYSPLALEQREPLVARRLREEAASPFDHSRAPLIRFFLLREDIEQHILLIVASRVILDRRSFELGVRDLLRIYEARRQDRDLPSSRRARFLAENGADSHRALELAGAAERDDWSQELESVPTRLDLGAERPRPPSPSSRAERHALSLTPELTATLDDFCRQQGLPPSAAALAALEVVLARYSGRDDFAIGVEIRPRQLAEQIGMFTRTLAARSDVDERLTFGELARRVHARLQAGASRGDASRELPIVFGCHDSLAGSLSIQDARLERIETFAGASPSELAFHFECGKEEARLLVDAASDLYSTASAARLCKSWLSVLQAGVREPELTVDELPVVTPDDERRLLDTLNDTRCDWDEAALVHRLIEAQVDARPQAVALCFEDQGLTFEVLDARANQLAHVLVRRGVGQETLVGLSLRRSPELVVAMLAILKAGGAYVPLDPDYPAERLEYMLADSHARLLITTSELAERLSTKPDCLLLDRDASTIAAAPSRRLRPQERSSQLCYVIYTSGSTGKPKGVMVEHRNVTSFFQGMRRAIGLDDHGTWLAATSVSFDISVLEILGSLAHGRRVVLLGDAPLGQVADDRYGIPATIERHGVTHFQCTPSQARLLLLDESGRSALARLEQLLIGGEVLGQELADQLAALVKGQVYNLYGPTETTVWSTVAQVEPGARVTIGRPIANSCLFVLDAKGRLAPPGAVGELYIGGPGVARGYHGRTELTRERFIVNQLRPERSPRLYRTGDLVRYASDGRLLYVGRNDQQLKIRGRRVDLGEIEASIRTAEGVRDVAVVARGAPDDLRLAAYLVTGNAYRGDAALRARLRDTLPEYMLPAAIVQLEALPLTPSGKVDRSALPEIVAPRRPSKEYAPPRTERERKLAGIWQRALGVERVGRCDSFFDLGGHSLLAVKISNEVEREFGARLPLATLFECPTLEAFATRLDAICDDGEGGSPAWTTLVPIQPEGSLPPLYCVAGLGGNPMNLFHLACALGNDQPFYGLQLRGVDGQLAPHCTVQAMAEEFVAELRARQPRGPFYLGGYSFGGLVALEMASLLREAGETVGLVVLLDTKNPKPPDRTLWQRARTHLEKLREQGPAYVTERLMARARDELVRRRRRLYAKLARLELFEYRNEAVWEAAERAMASYEPELYTGSVLLLQAQGRSSAQGGSSLHPREANEANGWRELLPALQVVRIPSQHGDVVSEQASPLAASAVRQALQEARNKAVSRRVPPASTPADVDPDSSPLTRVA